MLVSQEIFYLRTYHDLFTTVVTREYLPTCVLAQEWERKRSGGPIRLPDEQERPERRSRKEEVERQRKVTQVSRTLLERVTQR